MKKISTILVSLIICFVSILCCGCTYADNASLLSIKDKYNYIANKNENFFNGDRFIPVYNSDKLNNVILNSEFEEYTVLKTDNLDTTFTNRGAYGILMQAVNSTYCSMNNAFSIISNNEITEKKYKKNMYLALESLQKNIKTLDTSKDSLESSFNNNSASGLEVSQEGLVKHNLKNYKTDLNNCLVDLLNFNKNYTNALNNNIQKPISLADLLYDGSLQKNVSNWNNNMLVNNFNMFAANFVLNYSIKLKDDILSAKVLIDNIAQLLNIQAILPSESSSSQKVIDEYKIIRTLEHSILQKENVINSGIKVLNINSFDNPSVTEANAINSIEDIYSELVSYSSRLIKYLNNLN